MDKRTVGAIYKMKKIRVRAVPPEVCRWLFVSYPHKELRKKSAHGSRRDSSPLEHDGLNANTKTNALYEQDNGMRSGPVPKQHNHK